MLSQSRLLEDSPSVGFLEHWTPNGDMMLGKVWCVGLTYCDGLMTRMLAVPDLPVFCM